MYATRQESTSPGNRQAAVATPPPVLIQLFPSQLSIARMRDIFKLLDGKAAEDAPRNQGLCTPEANTAYIWTPSAPEKHRQVRVGLPGSAHRAEPGKRRAKPNIQLLIKQCRCDARPTDENYDLLTCIYC